MPSFLSRSSFRVRWIAPAAGTLATSLALATAATAQQPAPAAGSARPVAAAAARSAPEKVTTVEGITEYRLANGLKVLLFPDPSRPTVTVNITYLVGSRHEGYGETGMAHLLEHLVFKGSTRHKDIPKELSERGARPNGTTWYDRTNYFETVAATDDNLAWALDLEADRMVNSFIAKKDLDSEFSVVRNEFEIGENSPGRVLLERIMSTAFLWHNYGKSTIGARSDVEGVPIERLKAFYQKYYQPDNAVLVVAGKFDEAKTLRLIQQKFGTIPKPVRSLAKGNLLYPTYTREPVQDGERLVTLKRVGDEQLVGVAYHVPALAHADNPAVQVLAGVLGERPNGRLYKALVESKLAAGASAFTFDLKEPGLLLGQANLRVEQNLDTARAVMLRTIDEVVTNAPTDDEVNRVKAALLKQVEQLLADPDQVGLTLTEYEASGDWRLFFLTRDRIEKVTAADVQRVAKAYLKPDNRTVGLFVPTKAPDRAEIPEALNASELMAGYKGRAAVAAGETFDATPANLDKRTRRVKLPNGMWLTLLPKSTRGANIYGDLVLRHGALESLQNRAVAGQLVGAMYNRGTTLRSRQAIKDTLDKLKATVTLGNTGSSSTASLQVKREQLAPTLRLVAEMLQKPAFDSTEFEQLRTQQLAAIEAGKSEPQAIAVTAFQRRLRTLPKGHPEYTPTIEESIEALKSVTRADLVKYHADFAGAQAGDLALVGDFDPDSVITLARELFGTWTAKSPWKPLPRQFAATDSATQVFETPDKQNAMFVAGQTFPLSDTDPDYAAMTIGAQIMGGGFLKSRMADRMRQKDGVSYAVGSQFSARPMDREAFALTFALYAPQNVDKVVTGFREELAKLIAEGVTQEELDQARQGWLREQQQQFANDNEVASTLVVHRRWERSYTTYEAKLAEQIGKLSVADVNAALRKYLDPAKTFIVRAGDFEGAKKKKAEEEAKKKEAAKKG
ncbi:MAG: M16 family metallopeptidase [Gemmatimonas sp.]|jgi:zinc protease|uniref:M16 family metallopeptidase n=1 Tax=Gemmatimonas sp. TaxID=1962908 RepID=UPI00391F31F9